MADEPVSGPIRKITTDDAEMVRYRARLAARLSAEPTTAPTRPWFTLPGFALAAVAVAFVAAALGLKAFIDAPAGGDLAAGPAAEPPRPAVGDTITIPSTLDLASIESIATIAQPELIANAWTMVELRGNAPDQVTRWNAIMLLALADSPHEAIRAAAIGAQEDPRAEFRYRYLELLLDDADEYRYDSATIEGLMDRETDRGCLELYRAIFDLVS